MGKIKVRPLAELISEPDEKIIKTERKPKNYKNVQVKIQEEKIEKKAATTTSKNKLKVLPGQKLIDNFFKTGTKTYKIEAHKTFRRKELFPNSSKKVQINYDDIISIGSSDDDIKPINKTTIKTISSVSINIVDDKDSGISKKSNRKKPAAKRKSEVVLKTQNNADTKSGLSKSTTKKPKKPPRMCPSFKIIEDTTFAVDAFCYGDIERVTHYFLTHYHADHYTGLNRKFSHDIYMSSITARLLRTFIPIDEQYIHELNLNETIEINGTEITAIDANHCPGAIMLIFKIHDKCILHTGDFRAWHGMESEPIFWNNDIHTIYLDTTYLTQKSDFCTQEESTDRAIVKMEEFMEKNVGTRVLYVCGSYLVGKEKFWTKIAGYFSFKVWTTDNRKQALLAIQNEEHNQLLTDDPIAAQLHVIPMTYLSYEALLKYLSNYSEHFDVVFALRPSGWEKDKRPQYRGKINIIGIEYSEHSSHDEMKRFVRFLKPKKVISTVPISTKPLRTPNIPKSWYNYNKLSSQQQKLQPSITTYFKAGFEWTNERKRAVCKKNNQDLNLSGITPLVEIEEKTIKSEQKTLFCKKDSENLNVSGITSLVEAEENAQSSSHKNVIQCSISTHSMKLEDEVIMIASECDDENDDWLP